MRLRSEETKSKKRCSVEGWSKVSFDMFELFAMLHGSFVSSLEVVSIHITALLEQDSYNIASYLEDPRLAVS